ncbi:hypothetical protein ACOMHN_037228 [Nucella lapillus]
MRDAPQKRLSQTTTGDSSHQSDLHPSRGIQRQSDDGICSIWIMLRIIIICILLISVAALGVVSYLTMQQIDELKDQINACGPMNGTIDYSVLENEELAKLESGSRSNVLFKPSKKMKKRRQLDALVSNGKKLPRRKQSGHELLRSSDSDSSEVEEFSVLESQKWTKRWPSPGCCSMCYTLTCIVVLALCVLACGALIWMHLQLKHDFNQLKDRVNQVENKNAGTPGAFQDLQLKLKVLNKTVSGFKTGTNGLQDLNKSILAMQKQITSLMAAAAEHKKTAQASESSTKENLAVAKTVADLGANLQLTQTAVETLKTSQKTFATQLETLTNRVLKLEKPGGRERGSSPSSSPQLQELLSQMNATFTQSVDMAMSKLDRQQSQLDVVDKFAQDLDKQLKNVSQAVADLSESQQHLTDLVNSHQVKPTEGGKGDAALTQLQGQMQRLQLMLDQMQSEGAKWNRTGKGANSSELSPNSPVLQSLLKDHEDFVVFRTEVFQDITYLNSSVSQVNASVGVLNKDIEELFSKLGLAMSDLTNITAVVEGLARFLNAQTNVSTTTGAGTTFTARPPAAQLTPENSGNLTSPAEGASSGESASAGSTTAVAPDTLGKETSPTLSPEENAAGSSAGEAPGNNKQNRGSKPSEAVSEATDNTDTDSNNAGM